MVLQSVLLPIPVSPGTLTTTTSSNIGLPASFTNTFECPSTSFTIPAITREVEAFILKGRFVIGSKSATNSLWWEKQNSLVWTSHAVFPRNTGAHALIKSVTLTAMNGTIITMELDYTGNVQRCTVSAPIDTSALAGLGAQVHFDEFGHAAKPPISINQMYRDFFIRLRLPFNASFNMLAVGGLVLTIVWNSPMTACTFPNLIFPMNTDTSKFGDSYFRPFVSPYIPTTLSQRAVDIPSFPSSNRSELSFLPLGENLYSGYLTSFRSMPLCQVVGPTSQPAIISMLNDLCFYISYNLQLVVSQSLITKSESKTFESKAPVLANLPRTAGNNVALNLPLGGYCVGDLSVLPFITAEQSGLGFQNAYSSHGTVSNNAQWLFNSSWPGYTYPVFGNPKTEYSPFIATLERHGFLSDRFKQFKPLHLQETSGPGRYNFGKMFIGATSSTLNMTAVPLGTYYPRQTSIMSSKVISGEGPAMKFAFNKRALLNTSAENTFLSLTVSTSGIIANSSDTTISTTNHFLAPSYSTVTDMSKEDYAGAKYDSSVLPTFGFQSPVARCHHDMRSARWMRWPEVNESGVFAPPLHTSADLLIPYINDTNVELRVLMPSIQTVSPEVEWTLLSVNARVEYPDVAAYPEVPAPVITYPLLKSIPVRTFMGPPPDSSITQWRMVLDTFNIRTLSSGGMSIVQAPSSHVKPVNPVIFQSHPASPATDSPLYIRRTPLIDVPPLIDGNKAYQWDGISMGNVVASTLFLPVYPVDAAGKSIQSVPSSACVMPPLYAYADPALSACNRLTFTKVGESSTIAAVHMLTHDGILRSTKEKESIAREVLNMTQASRRAYNRRYRGHGAVSSSSPSSSVSTLDSPIYMDLRPSDRDSIFRYLGYKGTSFAHQNSWSFVTPKPLIKAQVGDPQSVKIPAGLSSPAAAPFSYSIRPYNQAASLTTYSGDLLSLLPQSQTLSLQLDQSYAFRAVMSLPQLPNRQFRIEMDGGMDTVSAVSCGGGAFSLLRTDPHVELALDAQAKQYPASCPTNRLRPALAYGSASSAVLVQLVYNPSDMAARSALAYAEGYTIPIPRSMNFDSYQEVAPNDDWKGFSRFYTGVSANVLYRNQQAPPGDPAQFDLVGGLTVYNNTPLPVGGLDIDHITIRTVAGRYDSADRSRPSPPLFYPKNAMHASHYEYSMSLFSLGARSSPAPCSITDITAEPPICNTVYMAPSGDGITLRNDSPYFGTELGRVEQTKLIYGDLIQVPHNALFDNGQPYLRLSKGVPSCHAYEITGGVVAFDPYYMSPTINSTFISCVSRTAYAQSCHRANPAIHGSAAVQTAWSMVTSYPSMSCQLELFTKDQLANCRMLSFNFQFNNSPLASIPSSTLMRYFNGYLSFPFSLTTSQFEIQRHVMLLNRYATPTVYTQTVSFVGTDYYKLTATGVYAVSKAFAN